MPQLLDPHFKRSVVLIVEHNEEGSMGLVLNHRSKLTFADLTNSLSEGALELAIGRAEVPLFVGGPVEPQRGFVLHNSPQVEERLTVVEGLYLSVTQQSLRPLLADQAVDLRFCLGYAGWGKGQLEKEINEGSWLFCEVAPQAVLGAETKSLWEDTLRAMGVEPGWLLPPPVSGGLN